jgi:predicted dehydrogenase
MMNNGKMMKSLPRICFFGCGYITAKHSKLLKKLFPEIELSYAGVEPAEAIEYRDRFRGASAFDTYREAAQSDAFDIAFIATPHAFHAELAVLAAQNGKDLIIEKPIARNLKEFSAIERAVKRNRVRCTMAENYLYKPFIRKVREYIDDGFIGEVLCIELNKTNRDTVTGWRTDAEMMGGGALLEGGVHWVNLLVSLAASHPQEVVAFKPEVRYDTAVPFEDTVLLTVRFQNGVIGKLLHSWRIPNTLRGVRLSKIYGSEGATASSSGSPAERRKFPLIPLTSSASGGCTAPSSRRICAMNRGNRLSREYEGNSSSSNWHIDHFSQNASRGLHDSRHPAAHRLNSPALVWRQVSR